jgi:hypothetical protein
MHKFINLLKLKAFTFQSPLFMFSPTKQLLVVLAFFLHNISLQAQSDMHCPSPVFFKTFGADGPSEFGTAITRSADNHLFVAGRDGNRTFIQKMDASGVVIWTRTFQVSAFEPLTPSEIIFDSEGMLVGCGTQGQAGFSRGTVFRYNPNTNAMLWLQQISSNNPTMGGILEKGPGGNFLVYQNTTLGNAEKDIEIIELDRTTGQLNSSQAKRYEHISYDVLSKMIYHDGELYACGTAAARHGNFNAVSGRQLLARFDPNTLDPIWAHLNHLDTLAPQTFVGRDMVADSNFLVSMYNGSPGAVNSGQSDTLYMMKTDLNGNIQWVRSYSYFDVGILKLLRVSDGYIVYGQGPGKVHQVFKTDKNGIPQWGRKLTETVDLPVFPNNFAPNQASTIGDSLYLTGFSTNGGGDVFLWKLLTNGSVSDSCGIIDTLLVHSFPVENPFRTIAPISQVFSTATSLATTPVLQESSLELQQFCPDCSVPDPCPEDNDFVVEINDVYCEQGIVNMQFTFCDLNGDTVPPLRITFFDADPYTQEANVLGSYEITPGLIDSCWSAELTDLVAKFGAANVQNGATYFAAVNVPANAQTPLVLDEFPLTDFAECNYTNNVGSYTVQLPPSPTLNLGPDQVVCPENGATLNAGPGFYKYLWSNGQTSPSINVNFSGSFRVTVTDFCGFRQTDTVLVTVQTTPQISEEGSFCPGGSVTIRGFEFDQPGLFQQTLPGQNNQCDTVVTFSITQLQNETRNEILRFCPGDFVVVNGVSYYESGLALDTLPGTVGCDTVVFYFLQQLPLPFRLDTAYICPGDSVLVGDVYYSQPGLAVDTLPNLGTFGCDTLLRVRIILLPQPTVSQTIQFCPGQSVMVNGQTYTQPQQLSFLVPDAAGGCDSLFLYNLEWLPAPTRQETVEFCQGTSVSIGGNTYSSPGTVQLTIPGLAGECDTLVTYTLEWLPAPTRDETIQFCPGTSVEIDGVLYTQPGTVSSLVSGQAGACDTLVNYTLEWLPGPTRSQTDPFCPGSSLVIAGVTYTQPGTVLEVVSGTGGGCDTVVTHTLVWLPYNTAAESIGFCPGQSVTLGGNSYTQPGTVIDTIPSANGGCDVIVTYTLSFNSLPTRSETREFCAGETVVLGGQSYTQPGTVVLTVPGSNGACDTVVTYTLQYVDAQTSTLTVTCPFNVNVITIPGTGPVPVNYNLPTANSNCVCPGIEWTLTAGLTPGSVFPPGMTPVCYQATDSCGSTASCCFEVIVREEGACETKTQGCIKYDILAITSDPQKRYTYKIRVTNNCTNKLIYTAIQLPDAVEAVSPATNSVYVSPEGRSYLVRNPNYAPFYSIRFKSMGDSIANGQSTVFSYTLPPQSHPNYIHIMSRLSTQVYYEAHLNTFNCPIGVSRGIDRGEESEQLGFAEKTMFLFPNPSAGTLFLDMSDWQGEQVDLRAFDSRGQQVFEQSTTAAQEAMPLNLSASLPNGLYFLEVRTEDGARQVLRFVLEH